MSNTEISVPKLYRPAYKGKYERWRWVAIASIIGWAITMVFLVRAAQANMELHAEIIDTESAKVVVR